MPKNDIGGLKAIGNAIKAKGLQKLRWYCQMCQKQCRDENGFKVRRARLCSLDNREKLACCARSLRPPVPDNVGALASATVSQRVTGGR
jgi:hypothetical protein